jgi:DNA primase
VLREELRQAALKRRDHVEAKASPITEVEKKLIRALAITDPENIDSRRIAMEAIAAKPDVFQQLGTYPALLELAARQSRDPIDVVTEEGQRGLVMQALLHEVHPPPETEISGAIQELEERAIENRMRDVRAEMTDAERRGDLAKLPMLMKEKVELDRTLRELRSKGPDSRN